VRWVYIIVTTVIFGVTITLSKVSLAADFVVYSVYRGLNLGNSDEMPEKDFYVNMGAAEGLHEGSELEVFRRLSTYDLMSEQLYKDVVFPIALVKVIHVEPRAAIARLDKMLPLDKTPSISPRAVMIGDIVRLPESK